MRLLLLFEPGFMAALVAMISRYSHDPSLRLAVGIAAVALLALLPFGLLLRRRSDGTETAEDA
jgi:hypothetical protein